MDVYESQRDCYDEQIERLMGLEGEEFERAVNREWINSYRLFAYLGSKDGFCGCPTMVKQGVWVAFEDNDFTNWVRSHDIPNYVGDIQKHHLPIFAEIQRRADREFRNQGGEG